MKKLFTDDKFFLVMVLCAVIGKTLFALGFIKLSNDNLISQIPLFLRVCCVVVLYFSYKKHSKNVMKGMMGALLMGQLTSAFSNLTVITVSFDSVFKIVFIIVSLLLFINHFVINSEHAANPSMICVNQLLLIVLVIDFALWDYVWAVDSCSMDITVCAIMDFIGTCGMAASIVCVESRLDAYRLDREEAGWTEEKGYPDGYVHEYEKKDYK